MMKNCFWVFIFVMAMAPSSWAVLQVFPTRVLLTDKERSAQIALRHTGDKPATYRIAVIFYKMNPDGSMVEVENPKPEDRFGQKYFQYSPRKVDLKPNVEQVVRLVMRKPADLPEGEYRAHLHFSEDAEPEAPSAEAPSGNTFKMSLKARIALAVPVIVRSGDPKFSAEIKDLKLITLADGKKGFSADLSNQGNANVFGDLRVFFTPGKGKEVLVGEVNSFSSYIPQRSVVFPFSNVEFFKEEKHGKLRMELRNPSAADSGKDAVLASQEITI